MATLSLPGLWPPAQHDRPAAGAGLRTARGAVRHVPRRNRRVLAHRRSNRRRVHDGACHLAWALAWRYRRRRPGRMLGLGGYESCRAALRERGETLEESWTSAGYKECARASRSVISPALSSWLRERSSVCEPCRKLVSRTVRIWSVLPSLIIDRTATLATRISNAATLPPPTAGMSCW